MTLTSSFLTSLTWRKPPNNYNLFIYLILMVAKKVVYPMIIATIMSTHVHP